MDSELLVKTRVQEAVGTITLASDSNRNALSFNLRTQLIHALNQMASDHHVRAVVFSHEGKVFCSGLDLSQINASTFEDAADQLTQIFELLTTFPKPLICKLNGPAIAGGLGLVAACDFVVANEDLKFSFSEVRIGVSPAIISRFVLEKMNTRKALEYLLTGIVFDARQALNAGLLNSICPQDQLDELVDYYVNEFLKIEPNAFFKTKKLLNEQLAGSKNSHPAKNLSKELFLSQVAQEGRDALKAKSKPSWNISKDN